MIKIFVILSVLFFSTQTFAAVTSNTVSVEGKLVAIEKDIVTLEDLKTQKRFLVPRDSIAHLNSHMTGRSIVTANLTMSSLFKLNKIKFVQ